MDNNVDFNYLTSQIIKAAIRVHKELGPGLLESVYQRCMIIELETMGHKVASEVLVPVAYRGELIHNKGFKIDLLVEGEIPVELKSAEAIKPVYKKQLLTYLRLMKKPVGLLINFNEVLLKDGIVRIVNNFRENTCPDPSSPGTPKQSEGGSADQGK